MALLDPIKLSQELIRCPSITPVNAGALDVIQSFLEKQKFTCYRQIFEEPDTPPVDNLYARIGDKSPNLCFAGHTDVVPPGDESLWAYPPFSAQIIEGKLFGRGAADMKCAIAAFAIAASKAISQYDVGLPGSISLLITGDEEGISINGTRKMLHWLEKRGEKLSACLVGEPTSPNILGEMAKVGRRGSINFHLIVKGTQGHAAYPDIANNPIPHMVQMLNILANFPLDNGSKHFQKSTLTITTIDTGNPSTNVIPSQVSAGFNVRFNDLHTSSDVEKIVRNCLDRQVSSYELSSKVSGESFLSPPGILTDAIIHAAKEVTDIEPKLSTTGGTSDARFIKDFCPVVEFGMTSETAHKINEYVRVEDIHVLSKIYKAFILKYFQTAAS